MQHGVKLLAIRVKIYFSDSYQIASDQGGTHPQPFFGKPK
jgi:hypothetical protein